MTIEERIIEAYENIGTIAGAANKVNLNPAVVKKVLISNGIIPSAKSELILGYLNDGLNSEQIAEVLKIKPKTLNGYIPYSKTPYVIGNGSTSPKTYKTEIRQGGNKMPYNIFIQILQVAKESADYEVYYAKAKAMLLPNIYVNGNYAESVLKKIYEFAHDHTYKKLLELTGMTNRYVANNYKIPPTTCENWRSRKKASTDYLLDLLAADMLTQ